MDRVPELVSVIVPSYNPGARRLRAQLAALARQDYAGDFEVIVADNGSNDGSTAATRDWTENRPDVRVIDASGRRGPGAARNDGARAAGGDFLAFCDADDVASAGWLRELVQTARDAALVGGTLDIVALNDPSVAICFDVEDPSRPHLGFLPSGAGANLGVWRDVFEAVGGFDERSRAGEDVAFAWRAQLLGHRYDPSPALVHKTLPTEWRDLVRRFFGYGLGDAWLYRDFCEAGMPRRSARDTRLLWQGLVLGFSSLPQPVRRRRWTAALALSCGRLVGSARHRVLFT